MKIYKFRKSDLIWKEMPQISYKWILPILVNHKREVIAGNSLKDSLPEELLIAVIEKNQILEDNLFYIESKVVEENNPKRIGTFDFELREYFKELRKPETEQLSLMNDVKEYGLISEENYLVRRDTFKSHGPKKEEDDYQLLLFEEPSEEIKKVIDEIEVDLEILKELL